MIASLGLGRRLGFKAALTGLFVIAADFLVFRSLQFPAGLAFTLLFAILGIIVLVTRPRLGERPALVAGAALIGALLALLEDVNLVSTFAVLCALSAFALAGNGRLRTNVWLPMTLAQFLAAGPFAVVRDGLAGRRVSQRRRGLTTASAQRMRRLSVWVMPVLLTLGFSLLFAAGNPVVSGWLAKIDLAALLALLDPWRMSVWIAAILLAWPFLRPRFRPFGFGKPREAGLSPAPLPRREMPSDRLFGHAAILRALVLFNMLFAMQTLLDAAYLWGGVSLPEGITHAAYAHRGAYLLVFTALLAAAFVLLSMRSGSSAAGDHRVQWLVYLWIGQNVVLVLSSMLRLDLYVEAYALTHWRVAAFLWMGLVMVGLMLIVVRIALKRDSRWLIGANTVAASAMIFVTCFVDFNGIIARFNVEHSREVGGEGRKLDRTYLVALGPSAIPAIDEFLSRIGYDPFRPNALHDDATADLVMARKWLIAGYCGTQRSWRSWTFRSWRLSRYLVPGVAFPDIEVCLRAA